MAGPLRNKQGCWTCRLRKKKCDEQHPQCATCGSLLITCYGYGPKPDWMDNGEKEKAVAGSLKEIVKRTSRRKARAESSEQQGRSVRIEPKPSNFIVDVEASHDSKVYQENTNPLSNMSNKIANSESHVETSSGPLSSVTTDDSVLLVHYIDNVFRLQYTMYQPGTESGGRGWLLALLLRSKPYYHAVLALSASHRRICSTGNPDQVAALVKQEEHLQVCLNLLNHETQNGCPKMGLGVMAAVSQVMFFEFFNSNAGSWLPHFQATVNMFQRGHSENFTPLGISESARVIILEELPFPKNDATAAHEVVSFRFHVGALFWLDIISSITTGKAPLLQSHHSRILGDGSQTKLRDIVGCDNSVLLHIARVSELHEHKANAIQKGHFDHAHFELTFSVIRSIIQQDIDSCSSSTVGKIPAQDHDMSEDPHNFITQMFAYMAAVYLHLVMYDFQNLEKLDEIVHRAMQILRTQFSDRVLPSLIPPLFIIGLVAGRDDQQFFRQIWSTPPLLNPFIRQRARILSILEEVWRRQGSPDFHWRDCIQLAKDILLI